MKVLKVAATVFSCVFAGMLTGVLTNAINGIVSPLYFRNIMKWHNLDNVWRASIAQGAFEGTIYGTLFAVLFTSALIYAMKNEYSYGLVLKYIACIEATVIGSWILGGIIAMALAKFSPEFYRHKFIGVPQELGAMLKYAWVGGSIWGTLLGGLLSSVLGSVILITGRKHSSRRKHSSKRKHYPVNQAEPLS